MTTITRPPERILRWVRHEHVLDYARMGWHLAEIDLAYHAQFAVLMEWLCNCPLPDPLSHERQR